MADRNSQSQITAYPTPAVALSDDSASTAASSLQSTNEVLGEHQAQAHAHAYADADAAVIADAAALHDVMSSLHAPRVPASLAPPAPTFPPLHSADPTSSGPRQGILDWTNNVSTQMLTLANQPAQDSEQRARLADEIRRLLVLNRDMQSILMDEVDQLTSKKIQIEDTIRRLTTTYRGRRNIKRLSTYRIPAKGPPIISKSRQQSGTAVAKRFSFEQINWRSFSADVISDDEWNRMANTRTAVELKTHFAYTLNPMITSEKFGKDEIHSVLRIIQSGVRDWDKIAQQHRHKIEHGIVGHSIDLVIVTRMEHGLRKNCL
eukprot:jgi/Hompol1/3686/HPOL_001662-RA